MCLQEVICIFFPAGIVFFTYIAVGDVIGWKGVGWHEHEG